MRLVTVFLCATALTACTAEQGKQFFEGIGSGVGVVNTSDNPHSFRLSKDDQTNVAAIYKLDMPYNTAPLIGYALSPDAFSTKVLITSSTSNQALNGSDMKISLGVFDTRTGKRSALRNDADVKLDLFEKKNRIPENKITEEWHVVSECWHSNDEFVIGIEYGFAFQDPQQFASFMKYKLDNTDPSGMRYIGLQYAGANISGVQPGGEFACKEHRLHDKNRYEVKNSKLLVDSTPKNTPVLLKEVVNMPLSIKGAEVILFK
jgi:hypothetical protein